VSRLWSRVGVRALAVGVLLAGAAGGVALGADRNAPDQVAVAGFDSAAEQTEQVQLKDNIRAFNRADARQRAAQEIARQKAAAAAKAAREKAAAAEAAARKARAEAATRSETRTPSYGPIPSSCQEYSGNKGIGCALMLQWGFGLDQMPCLVNMWNKESGWNERASNSSSGAYGIPQALPGSKMSVYGSDWQTNPATQIKWGLDYIKGRYSTPCGAWSYWQSHGWY
jgi:hypothetical protein